MDRVRREDLDAAGVSRGGFDPAASVALFSLVLAVNLVGDAVRDVLDPRTLRERQ